MKKTLVALAALASVSAFAQSSVTLYGRMDLGMANTKTTSNNAAGNNAVTQKVNQLAGNQSGITGMRLGVRGTEDLGGGLNLGFVLETNAQPDEVAPSGTTLATFGTTRLANLSLTTSVGRFTIGTFDNAFDTVRGYNQAIYSVPGGDFLSNMFNPSAAGATGAPFMNFGGNAIPVGLRQRSQNAVAWGMASNGFTFGLGTTQQSDKTDTNGVRTADAKINGVIAAVGYANGPLAADFTIGSAKATTAVNTGAKLNDWAAAVKYDLGVAVPYFIYEKASTGRNTSPAPTGGKLKGTGWVLGSTFPMGAVVPYVAFSSGKYTNDIGAVGGAALAVANTAKTSGSQIGVRYSLSKRSTVYAAYGTDKIRETTAGANSQQFSKRTGYNVGLRHDF